MPLTLRFCISCGADPQVRAGRPRPAFADGIEIRVYAKKADGGVGRGPGGPPHRQSKWHSPKAPAPPRRTPLRTSVGQRLPSVNPAVSTILSKLLSLTLSTLGAAFAKTPTKTGVRVFF